MNRMLKLSLIGLLALLSLILPGCGSKGVPEGALVSIIYSSDMRGRLDGCGCRGGAGGIARRSAAIAQARAEDPSVIYCDAGNFMTGTAQTDSSQGQVTLAAYTHMKANVVNVSERELAFGVDAFQKARQNAPFKFVSVNLRYKGDAIADPYVVQTVNEARVAFIGVCGPREVMRTDAALLPEGVTVQDPVSSVREAVISLRDKADLVVVLSTCGDALDSSLAHHIPGVNLIIGGRSFRDNAAKPWVVDSVRVVRAQHDGRTLGRMNMLFGQGGEIRTFSPSEITLETGAPEDKEMLAVIRKFVPDFEEHPAAAADTRLGDARVP